MQCIYFIDLIRMDLIESLKRFKLMEITMMIIYIYIYIFVRSDIDKLLLPIGCLRPFYSIPFDGGVVVVLSWQKTKKKNVYELMLMMTPPN